MKKEKTKYPRANRPAPKVSKRPEKPTPKPPPKDEPKETLVIIREKIKADQPNLFGEQDQVYNTIQEEISIIVATMVAGQEAISKKEDQLADLSERKQKLEKAAVTVAKLRDAKLKKKEKRK